jgi:hypothetical protein
MLYAFRMSPPAEADDPVETMVDELLEDLAEFFPAEMREEARAFALDAAAAHPVTRVLAARVRERVAPDRSGEEALPHALADDAEDKAGGDSK